MLVSHHCRFIVFPDVTGCCPHLYGALKPWLDAPVKPSPSAGDATLLFHGMTPTEAQLAFDLMGFDFHSYTKIAVVTNPFKRMAHLYDKIAQTDPVWRMRRKLGLDNPRFDHWLDRTKPEGGGIGTRWRRISAWSTEYWSNGKIDHFICADSLAQDLPRIFRQLPISPAIAAIATKQTPAKFTEMMRYDAESAALIKTRYAWDLQLFHGQTSKLELAA